MNVPFDLFGSLPDGRPVQRYTLHSPNGHMQASFLEYGGILQSLRFEGRKLVLGYDTLSDYLSDTAYLGATVGRYANRIAGGRFTLNGQTYRLECNEGGVNQLHGGSHGFSRRIWEAEILEEEIPSLRLTIVSPDGEDGYPGLLRLSVVVSLTDDSLTFSYEAVSDQDTVINFTNHAYFNLDGQDVLDTQLTIEADTITPVNEQLIPTGEILPVDGTPFDFRTAKPIGRDILSSHPQMRIGNGYDHNFVLKGEGMRLAAAAVSPRSGIRLECYTDQPGVQLYTANSLSPGEGKMGMKIGPHMGFCLETQHFPDSPNQPSFPSVMLPAGQKWRSQTLYRVSQTKK